MSINFYLEEEILILNWKIVTVDLKGERGRRRKYPSFPLGRGRRGLPRAPRESPACPHQPADRAVDRTRRPFSTLPWGTLAPCSAEARVRHRRRLCGPRAVRLRSLGVMHFRWKSTSQSPFKNSRFLKLKTISTCTIKYPPPSPPPQNNTVLLSRTSSPLVSLPEETMLAISGIFQWYPTHSKIENTNPCQIPFTRKWEHTGYAL